MAVNDRKCTSLFLNKASALQKERFFCLYGSDLRLVEWEMRKLACLREDSFENVKLILSRANTTKIGKVLDILMRSLVEA